jgi:signal transduction histidine kinase
MVDRRTPEPEPAGRGADYYDPAWGELVTGQGIDEGQEPWFPQLALMQVYGFVLLGGALWTAYPQDDPGGWHGPLAVALIGLLAVAFWFMWVRRPLWTYPTRILAVHGVFQVATYMALVSVAPGFAVLQLLVYPQILFSLQVRWSVIGGLAVAGFTALAILVRAAGDLAQAWPGVFANLLAAAMVIALALWVRETISLSIERRALIEQLRAARRDLAAAERAAGVAEERARLAREIHDTLAQGFASVVAHLEAADARLGAADERARRDVRAAEEVARASLGEARTLVWALRPETIAASGLPAAIERVAAAGGGSGGADGSGPAVEVTISGVPRQLHPEVEVALLRAAQECLANARRHAAATHISVTLTYFADEVSLDVIDDGSGFDASAGARSGGMGLLGMRERAERLGGTVAIETAPREGTAVAVTLPAIEPPVAAPAAASPEGATP